MVRLALPTRWIETSSNNRDHTRPHSQGFQKAYHALPDTTFFFQEAVGLALPARWIKTSSNKRDHTKHALPRLSKSLSCALWIQFFQLAHGGGVMGGSFLPAGGMAMGVVETSSNKRDRTRPHSQGFQKANHALPGTTFV